MMTAAEHQDPQDGQRLEARCAERRAAAWCRASRSTSFPRTAEFVVRTTSMALAPRREIVLFTIVELPVAPSS